MKDTDPKPLNYAPPPRRERVRLRDLSLADWIILFMAATFFSALVLVVVGNWLAPNQGIRVRY